MPRISKQQATPRISSNGQNVLSGNGTDVLDRLEDMDSSATTYKVCLYGGPKTGKTTLACDFPKPILLIGTEDGRKSVGTIPGGRYVRLRAPDEVRILAEAVANDRITLPKGPKDGGFGDKPYRTVVLDTGGGLQDLVMKDILGLDELPMQKSWGMADKKTWGIIGGQTKDHLKTLLNLAELYGKNVVVVAHERNFKEDEDSPGSEMLMPVVGAAMSPSVSNWISAECDYIGQCFCRPQKKEVVKTVNKQEIKKLISTGKSEFCLRLITDGVHRAGLRVPRNTPTPEIVVNPTFELLSTVIQGRWKAK